MTAVIFGPVCVCVCVLTELTQGCALPLNKTDLTFNEKLQPIAVGRTGFFSSVGAEFAFVLIAKRCRETQAEENSTESHGARGRCKNDLAGRKTACVRACVRGHLARRAVLMDLTDI